MKLSAQEDLNAPIEAIFAQIIDGDAYERAAMRRGVQFSRSGQGAQLCAGDEIKARFTFRGRRRDLNLKIRRLTPPDQLILDSRTGGMEVTTQVSLIPLSPQRTRLAVENNLKPKTLSARLLVQSLKLTRGSVERKLRKRFVEMARALEARAQG